MGFVFFTRRDTNSGGFRARLLFLRRTRRDTVAPVLDFCSSNIPRRNSILCSSDTPQRNMTLCSMLDSLAGFASCTRLRIFTCASSGLNDEVATSWLNDEAVRSAIHAQPNSIIGPWELCTDKINYYHDAGSMIKYHKKLTVEGYRALIFSGDHDMCVPFTGTQAWTRSLGYNITDQWRAWYLDDQVAGYTQGYDYNLTFVTVKGSGHTVAEYKPKEALALYSRWLGGWSV